MSRVQGAPGAAAAGGGARADAAVPHEAGTVDHSREWALSGPAVLRHSLAMLARPALASPPFPARALLRGAALAAALLLCALAFAGAALADPARARVAAPEGVAVGGYDPVAYFVDGSAVPGRPDIALRWRGVRWHFATAAHRSAFEADPMSFAPQFGGYCAISIGTGQPVAADPRHWAIVDGRLYLAQNAAHLSRILADPQATLAQARQNWPRRGAAAD